MKNFASFWLGIGWLLATTGGCGGHATVESASSGGSGGSGGSGASDGSGGSGGGAGETPATGLAGSATFAIRKLWLGDTLPDGQPSPDAWKLYGFDLDGKTSTGTSTDLCQPPNVDASKGNVHPDGEDGIDNSFGRNLLPVLISGFASQSSDVNALIDAGKAPTILLRLEDLGTSDFVADAFIGEREEEAPGAPAWNGSDVWPVRGDGFEGGDVSSPKARFTESEVVVNAAGELLFRARGAGKLRLLLPIFGSFDLLLPLRNVRVSAVLSDDLAHAVRGRLGGIVDTARLVFEVSKLCADCPYNPTCEPPATDIGASTIAPWSDILLDGSQDSGATCDGISLGLGFEAEAVVLGEVLEIPPDPCGF